MHVLVMTTASRLAWFEVLRASVLTHHPGATVTPVLCDGRAIAGAPDGPSIRPQGWRVGDHRYVDLVHALGDRAAGWAALPWVLDAAALEDPPVVLSDTVQLLGPVDQLLHAATDRGAVARSVHRDRSTGLGWGGCLPGVLALGGPHDQLMAWWRARLATVLASDSDRPVDDLWSALPVDAAVAALADPGLRLCASTAGEIDLAVGAQDELLADGEQLVLADMDGLDPARPWWFPAPDGVPRRHVSESPELRRLIHEYAHRLVEAGWVADLAPADAVPGIRDTPELRRWYRRVLAASGRGTLPPNPYVAGQVGAYLDLLGSVDPEGTTAISVHADLVMEARPDLRAAFPAVRWSGRDDMVRWMWSHGLDEGQTSLALLPDLPAPRPRAAAVVERRPFGVNLIGYLSGELGLGVAARRMKTALEAAGVPVASVAYDRTSSRMTGPTTRSSDAPYLFNLIVITPDQLPYFVEDVGAEFLAGHHNIGLWYWETDVLTPRQLSSFAWVDEVWGATRYLCDVFASAGRVPVTHVPVPLVFDDPAATDEDRVRLGLDERFTVLFSFDFLSVVERKNPLGLIEAYRRAFAVDDGARLILKGINGDQFPDKREELLDAAADRPDIDVWDRYLSSRDRLALVQLADCYASLHRSEGLGLTMAEAMALGTPVVATEYSGNLDFMDGASALLVPAAEVQIGPGSLYPAEGHWADPDLDVAASHLRRLRDDPELRERLVAAGRVALQRYDVASVGDVASARLRALGQLG